MRYGIDIDGVVADFITAFVRETNTLWPGKLPIGYQPTDWEWSDKMTKDEIDQVWKAITSRHDWWLTLPPDFENVRAIALHRIHHPDDEIFFVTARVATKGMPVMHQTQIWLNQCGIGGLGTAVIVDDSGDKSSIFNALECDANIDDKLEAVIEHHSKTRGACLLARPWNVEGRPIGFPVARNLAEFFKRVGGRNVTSSK